MVSQQRLKRPVSALVAIVFLLSLLIPMFFEVYTTVSANTPIKPVILELTDVVESGKQADYNHTDGSQLGSIITSKYDVVTMTMKQFNASREELLGKYDAIIFGPSRAKEGFEYAQKRSVTPANKEIAHDTSAYENDITQLKIDQIKSSLLNNGVPVYLHQDTIAQNRNFEKFDPTTVTFYSTQREIEAELADFFNVRKMNRFSSVKLTQDGKTLTSLVDIESSNVVSAVRGKPIDFVYSLGETPSNQAVVELYLDFDSNDRFTSQELISSSSAVKDGKLSYTIDVPSFTSPRFWKLIVKDPVNQSYTYTTGRFLLKDQIAKAKVLQITADNSGTGRTGSLESTFPNGQMLSKSDLYQFDLEVINFKTFRDKMCPSSGAVSQANKDWFFSKDLMIFGFKDSYINGIEIDCASGYLTQYMDEGRGVMFTHDMLYRLKGNQNFGEDSSSVRSWERLYAKRFATKDFTNMGINAPLTTNHVMQAAKGLFTEYPYRLDEKPVKNSSGTVGNMIATTHNQYFSLDLNNEDLTVWYNLVDRETSSKKYRTVGDSANHYYMYTVGNLTYSGAGHTQTFSNQVEKEIFVNTMFRAFIGSNHAPEIKLHSPTLTNDQSTISDIEPLYVSWESLDYDFKDRFLETKVSINGKQVYPKDTSTEFARVDNGKRVGFYYDHGIKGSGTLNVQIETKDQGGATARKSFTVNVKPSTDVAFVSRTISPLVSEVGSDVTMTYDVTTRLPELSDTNKAAYDSYTWKVAIKETIPAGYDVKELPAGWSKDSTGKVLTATYCKRIVKGVEVAPPADCTALATSPKVILTAKQEGDFTFSQGSYTYNFVGKDEVASGETPLPDLKQDGSKSLNVVSTRVLPEELRSIRLEGPIYLSLGEAKQLIPTFTPNTTKKLDLRWTISSNTSELLPSYIDNSATVRGLKTGTSSVSVSYTSPLTGKTITSNTIEIIVDDPPLGFSANNVNVFVSEEGTITPRIVTSNSRYRAFTFEIVEGREFIDSVSTTTSAMTVRGKAKGTTRIKVSLTNQPLTQTIAPIFVNVNVSLPVLSMTPSEETLWVYKNRDGQVVQQEVKLELTQTSPIKLPVTWFAPTTLDAVTLTNGNTSGVTVKAVKGMYPNDQKIPISAILSNFMNERVQSFITVREYPQEVIAPNLELYMENSPYVYQPEFWPITSNVRGYGLEVAEGADIVQVVDDTKLVLRKPGVARIRIATEDVSRFFPNGNGPEILYRDFLIRVRAGDDPNPETPNPDVGDYY